MEGNVSTEDIVKLDEILFNILAFNFSFNISQINTDLSESMKQKLFGQIQLVSKNYNLYEEKVRKKISF